MDTNDDRAKVGDSVAGEEPSSEETGEAIGEPSATDEEKKKNDPLPAQTTQEIQDDDDEEEKQEPLHPLPQRPHQSQSQQASVVSSLPSISSSRRTRPATTDPSSSLPPPNTNPHPHQSLSDQVLQSALQGTVEFLKLAGGLTLNATGKVVAPPLHVTRTLILPQLWAATADLFADCTPQRLRDWFRIVQSAVAQFVSVLTRTERGQHFGQRVVLVLGDLVDCLSSDLTRQVLIDWMACGVKLGEALHTPEFERFLQQGAIWACRGVQALSSGRTQQLIHDTQTLLWSACALWADPQTVTALAEVTAYLCYALEMEDAVLDGGFRKGKNNPNVASSRASKKSARRKERDLYQKATYQDRSTIQNANTSVEQAILSSLGGSPAPDPTAASNDDDASTVTSLDENHDEPTESNDISSQVMGGSDTLSIRQQLHQRSKSADDIATLQDSARWDEKAHKDVNVPFLRQQIGLRPPTRGNNNHEEERCADAANGDDVEEGPYLRIVEAAAPNGESPSRRKRPTVQVETVSNDIECDEQANVPLNAEDGNNDNNTEAHKEPLERKRKPGETSSQYFFRVLDDLLADQRTEGMKNLLEQASKTSDPARLARPGNVRQATNNDSIRQRLDALRAELAKETPRPSQTTGWQRSRWADTPSPSPQPAVWSLQKYLQRYRWVLFALILALLATAGTWVGLGCYGLYVLYKQFRPPPHGSVPFTVAQENEIVVRVVREVVHLDDTGLVLGRSPEKTKLSQQRIDQISECVANAV